MPDTDVIVVGAGPAGSTVAAGLARAGVGVILADKSDPPGRDNVCAGMFGLPCASHFQIDPSVFEKVVYKGIHFFGFAAVEVENPDGFVMVLRDRFDRYLAERAANLGADLRSGTRVTGVRPVKTGMVEVRCQPRTGQEQTWSSRAVVFADGPHTLASRLFPDLGFRKSSANLSFAFSCDVEAVGNGMGHFEMYYDRRLADWGYGWVFPKKDLLNFGLVCRVPEYEGDKPDLKRRLEYLWHEHPRASRVLRGRRLVRKRGAMIPQKVTPQLVRDSIVVIGDAGGMADALLSGGIENAMQSGELAATVLEEGLARGSLDAGFLRRYEQAWKDTESCRALRGAERFRDLGCWLNRLHPESANRLKYLFALREKLRLRGNLQGGSSLRLALSPALRRSLGVASESIPWEF